MNLAQKTHFTGQTTRLLYACLLVAIAMDHALLRPLFHWPVWLVQTLPLLVVLPGLIKRQSRSAIWLCFIQLFYFLIFVEHAAMDSVHRAAYVSMVLLSVTLFTTSMLFARWCKQLSSQTRTPETSTAEDTSV